MGNSTPQGTFSLELKAVYFEMFERDERFYSKLNGTLHVLPILCNAWIFRSDHNGYLAILVFFALSPIEVRID